MGSKVVEAGLRAQHDVAAESSLIRGDVVEFEICARGHYPRWSYKTDFGRSGVWARGHVKYVDEELVCVGTGHCRYTWPLALIGTPGYPRRVPK